MRSNARRSLLAAVAAVSLLTRDALGICPSVSDPCPNGEADFPDTQIIVRFVGTLSFSGPSANEAKEIYNGMRTMEHQVNRMCSTPFSGSPADLAMLRLIVHLNITDDLGDQDEVRAQYQYWCQQVRNDSVTLTIFLGPYGSHLSQVAADVIGMQCPNRLLILHGPLFENTVDRYRNVFATGYVAAAGWARTMEILSNLGVQNYTLAEDSLETSDIEVQEIRSAAASHGMDEVLTLSRTNNLLSSESAVQHMKLARDVPVDAFIGLGSRNAVVAWLHNAKIFGFAPRLAYASSDITSWSTIDILDISGGLIGDGAASPVGWSYDWDYQAEPCLVFSSSTEFAVEYLDDAKPGQLAASAAMSVFLGLLSVHIAWADMMNNPTFVSETYKKEVYTQAVTMDMSFLTSTLTELSTSSLFTFYGRIGGDSSETQFLTEKQRLPAQIQIYRKRPDSPTGLRLGARVAVKSSTAEVGNAVTITEEQWELYPAWAHRESPCSSGQMASASIHAATGRSVTTCESCPPGTVASLGQAVCTPCPDGYFAAFNGSSSCSACPEGASCTTDMSRIIPNALPGYYTITDTARRNIYVMECNLGFCEGGALTVCSGNTVSIGCEQCVPGYTMIPSLFSFSVDYSCHECSSVRWFRLALIIVFVALLFGDKILSIGMKQYRVRNRRNTYLRSFFDHVQLTATVLMGSSQFIPGFAGYVLNVIQRPIDALVVFECGSDMFGVSNRAVNLTMGFICLPLFIGINVVTTATAFMLTLGKGTRSRSDGERLLLLVHEVLTGGMFHLFVFYQPSLVMMAYAIACDTIDIPRLVHEKDQECFSLNDRISMAAYNGILLYGIGVPVWFVVKTQSMRFKIYENDKQTRNDWGFLYDGYRYTFYNYEVVVMVHKFLLIAADIIPVRRLRMIARLMVIGAFFVTHLILHPHDYRDVFILARLQTMSHFALVATQLYLLQNDVEKDINLIADGEVDASFDTSIHFIVYIVAIFFHSWFCWLFMSHYFFTFFTLDEVSIFRLNKQIDEEDRARAAVKPKLETRKSFASAAIAEAMEAEKQKKETERKHNPNHMSSMYRARFATQLFESASPAAFAINAANLMANPGGSRGCAKDVKANSNTSESSPRSSSFSRCQRVLDWLRGAQKFAFDFRRRSFNITALTLTEQVMLYYHMCEVIQWYLYPVPYMLDMGGAEKVQVTIGCREFHAGLITQTMQLIVQEKREALKKNVAKAALNLQGIQQHTGWLENDTDLPPVLVTIIHLLVKLFGKRRREEDHNAHGVVAFSKEARKKQLKQILDKNQQDLYLRNEAVYSTFMVKAMKAVRLVDKSEATIRDVVKFKGHAHSTIVRFGAYPPYALEEVPNHQAVAAFFAPMEQPPDDVMKYAGDDEEFDVDEDDAAYQAMQTDILPNSQSLAVEKLNRNISVESQVSSIRSMTNKFVWFFRKEVKAGANVMALREGAKTMDLDKVDDMSSAQDEEGTSEDMARCRSEIQSTLADLTHRIKLLRDKRGMATTKEDTKRLGMEPASGVSKAMTKRTLKTLMDHIERVQAELGEQVRFCVIGPRVVRHESTVRFIQNVSKKVHEMLGRAVTLVNCGERGAEYIFTHSWESVPQHRADTFVETIQGGLAQVTAVGNKAQETLQGGLQTVGKTLGHGSTLVNLNKVGDMVTQQLSAVSANSGAVFGHTGSISRKAIHIGAAAAGVKAATREHHPVQPVQQGAETSSGAAQRFFAKLRNYVAQYDPNHIRNLCCFKEPSNYRKGKDVFMCQERTELRQIYMEVGDLYIVFLDSSPDTRVFEECDYLHSRGAAVVPIVVSQEVEQRLVPAKVLACPDPSNLILRYAWETLREVGSVSFNFIEFCEALEEVIVWFLKDKGLAEGGEDDSAFDHKMMQVLSRTLTDVQLVVEQVERHTDNMDLTAMAKEQTAEQATDADALVLDIGDSSPTAHAASSSSSGRPAAAKANANASAHAWKAPGQKTKQLASQHPLLTVEEQTDAVGQQQAAPPQGRDAWIPAGTQSFALNDLAADMPLGRLQTIETRAKLDRRT